MSEHSTPDDVAPDRPELPASDDPRESVGAYEASDGVVFYDTENPLAWVQASQTLSLVKMA